MRESDPTGVDGAAILPFAPRSFCDDATGLSETTSTIVAIVAVTLRHGSDETPEERLADLIEETGHAEIIEIQDACHEIFDTANPAHHGTHDAANDNGKMRG